MGGGGGGGGELSIFEMSHWPFSRGILKNTQKTIYSKITQKVLNI